MAQSIDRRGIASVLQGFDAYGSPYYAVMQGGDIKYYCDNEDMENAKQMLSDNLQAAHLAGSDAMYTIRFYKSIPDGGIDKKTGYIGSFNFKVQDTPTLYSPWQQQPVGQMPMIGASPELQEMRNKIAKLEEERDAVHNYEPPEVPPPGIIETLLNNPQMAVTAINGIVSLFKDLFRPVGSQLPTQQQPELYEIPEGAISSEEIEMLNYYRGLDETTKAFLKSQMKKT